MHLSLSVISFGPGCGRRWKATRRPLVGDRIDRDVDLAHIDERDVVLADGRVDSVSSHATSTGRAGLDDTEMVGDPL